MLQREDSAVENNSQLNEALLELKTRLLNPEAAAEVRQIAKPLTQTREPFDVSNYKKYLEDNPSFSYLHLVTSSDE